MTTEASHPEDLCTQCGLCCDGALFDFGPLSPDEVEPARQAGMAVVEADGKAGFLLPCPQLDCAVCQIYHERPQTCRDYQCQVLRSVNAGELEHVRAMQLIEQGRAALEQVKAQLAEGQTLTDVRKLRRKAGEADASAELNASPMLMMALGMLDVILDEHFRRPDQRQVIPQD